MGAKVVYDITISADGDVARPGRSREKPLGSDLADRLHGWMFETPDEYRAEVDAILAAGACIMGRNMFGPVRGEWDLTWRGWWGEAPPYHAPVFVLTHYAREPPQILGARAASQVAHITYRVPH